MKSIETVSIVIPAYNCADYIEKCIDSAINQTYGNVEVVVIDDGSTDNTLQILKKYGEKIKLITKSNGGSASARNCGIEVASGEYIMFMDSDDYLDKNCLAEVMSKLDSKRQT